MLPGDLRGASEECEVDVLEGVPIDALDHSSFVAARFEADGLRFLIQESDSSAGESRLSQCFVQFLAAQRSSANDCDFPGLGHCGVVVGEEVRTSACDDLRRCRPYAARATMP